MELSNKVTINIKEILEMPDNSITDPETIRQIGLATTGYLKGISREDSKALCLKPKLELSFMGLYPNVMKSFDEKPE